MKIVIDPFGKKSITAAINQVKQYKKDFLRKEEEFVRKLKEIGVSVAETGYAMADYDGVNDVLIAETQNGTRAAVIAYGETVGFIEFGTGVKFREYDSSNTMFTPPPHGSYGKGRGKNPHVWYFKQSDGASARHTYGNQPAEVMIAVRDEMVERIVEVAREVFK